MTEEERIFNGELFASEVDELVEKKAKAHRLSRQFNQLYEEDAEERRKILNSLLDECEEVTIMLGPIYFYYGCHTKQQKLLKLY